jgi:hypothetical protein
MFVDVYTSSANFTWTTSLCLTQCRRTVGVNEELYDCTEDSVNSRVVNTIIQVTVKVNLFLCLTKHLAIKTYWRNRDIAPRILNLGTRWRWVVSFMPRPLYNRGKNPWYPLDMRLGGPQSWSGRGGEDKKKSYTSPTGNWNPVVQPELSSYTDWATPGWSRVLN